MSAQPLLSLRRLHKTYPLKNKKHFTALNNISLDIYEGDFLVILGPSGSGKSTLLNIIAGLEKPDSGEIYLREQNITKQPPSRRNMSMVFQNYVLYPHMSVRENLAYPLKIKKLSKDIIEEEIRKISRDLDIEELLDRRPDQLSGGQKQRIAIARSILKKPHIYLFDEPFSNLDSRLKDKMRRQIKELYQKLQATIIYVTHDQIEAMSLATSLAVMDKGEIIQTGPPQKIYNSPKNIFIADFLGFPPVNICECEFKNSALYLEEHCLQKPISLNKDAEQEKNYLISIRPEDILPSASASGDIRLTLRIKSVEYLGSLTVFYAQIGKQDLCFCHRPEKYDNITPNQEKDFYIPCEKILIYSKKNKTLLGKLSDLC